MSDTKKKPTIAVFGAAGHIGRLVVDELLRRGITPIAIVREASSFAAAGLEIPGLVRRIARTEISESIDWAIEGTDAVINCAGPFIDTVDAIAKAAIRARIHYIDLSAETDTAKRILENYDKPARRMGMTAVPSMGFLGGVADLLASAALGDWQVADSIEISVALNRFKPTHGMRLTLARTHDADRATADDGAIISSEEGAKPALCFGKPVSGNVAVETAFSETALIRHRSKTGNVHSSLTLSCHDVLEVAGDDASGQRFALDVEVRQGEQVRHASLRGRDIYAVSAILAVAAAERLIQGRPGITGAFTPGELFDAKDILQEISHVNAYFSLPIIDQNAIYSKSDNDDPKSCFVPLEDWRFSDVEAVACETFSSGDPKTRELNLLDVY
jgi:hypothetical protein